MTPPNPSFLKAVPVWLAGCRTEMNVGVGFLWTVPETEGPVMIRVSCAGRFRVFVNGCFVAHGPERAAHGFARVEEWDVGRFFKQGENHVAVEVVAPRVRSFYTICEDGFLQAELVAGSGQPEILGHTTEGLDGGMVAFRLRHRVERVPRYSFQRTFSEVSRMREDSDAWRTGQACPSAEVLEEVVARTLLPRRAPLPVFPVVKAERIGAFRLVPNPSATPWQYRLFEISPIFDGFPEVELDASPLREWEKFTAVAETREGLNLATEEGLTCDFRNNLSGFIGLKVIVRQAGRLIVAFDEVLLDGRLDITRSSTINLVGWDLEPGEYELESFEPYTMRYVQVAVLRGVADIRGVSLRRYEAPIFAQHPPALDAELGEIFDAALSTLRQNAPDLLVDCPSRERAGWLADSFFSGRAAFRFSGTTAFESAFLENFLLAPEPLHRIPPGMLPMCYPSDLEVATDNFIPQWSLWLLLELAEFQERGGDKNLVNAFEPKVRRLIAWFATFENEIGLLEKLPGWQFIEWSHANELVNDVNFPTNWLYAAALEAAGALYHEPEWPRRAARIRREAVTRSWDGTWFRDRALRTPAGWETTPDHTEVCQYYALFFGAASPGTHPTLWARLVQECGPTAQAETLSPANFLPGWTMRFDLLVQHDESRRFFQEARRFLLPMARRTGTLWEHRDERASCCHAFTAYVGCLLNDVGGCRIQTPAAEA